MKIFGLTIKPTKLITSLGGLFASESTKAIAALTADAAFKADIQGLIDAGVGLVENGVTVTGVALLEKAAVAAIPLIATKSGITASKDFAIKLVQTVYADGKKAVESEGSAILAALGLK